MPTLFGRPLIAGDDLQHDEDEHKTNVAGGTSFRLMVSPFNGLQDRRGCTHECPHSRHVDFEGDLKDFGGSPSDHWNISLLNQTIQALWVKDSDSQRCERQCKATVSALIGIAPKDIEGMIAAQLLAAHNAAMECYRRAMVSEQTFEGRRENLSQANKLSRTYALLLDALNRHRGKGQQKVTVEHVHVHSGGQAIVGTVERPTTANSSRSEDRHLAKQISDAPQPSLRSPNQERDPLPSARDAERPMPNARWPISGSTEGK